MLDNYSEEEIKSAQANLDRLCKEQARRSDTPSFSVT